MDHNDLDLILKQLKKNKEDIIKEKHPVNNKLRLAVVDGFILTMNLLKDQKKEHTEFHDKVLTFMENQLMINENIGKCAKKEKK